MIRNGTILQQVALPAEREQLFAWFTDPRRLSSWMGNGPNVVPRASTETTLSMDADTMVVAADQIGSTKTGSGLDPRVGGIFSCELPGGHHWEGLVVEIDEPNRLVVTFGWRDPSVGLSTGMSLVEWDFFLDSRGSRLGLRHQHVPPDLLVLHNDTWGRLFARLRRLLLGRVPGPHPLENLPERLRELAAEGDLA